MHDSSLLVRSRRLEANSLAADVANQTADAPPGLLRIAIHTRYFWQKIAIREVIQITSDAGN
ncbi:MAG TPA: hypothetical protein VKV39_01270 [Candidatus Sulfotelmatobacter sp.]|nr:hypothetical protein [Candidatus Sulfotelmatobacter sp.]